uniref:Uncharacterized protein n=1 Tax=Candidatus Kentrum sp. UNK TaxID=2126344 RepID=A0A451AN51_9GAMM|nr:MAG: hypothetical protein BECKUNK1418G_GA0071005_11428 [Candidatus Kentron sp. UNK]VFK72793.1 MAG: hypothetical protein BECKUNK1418H_GA0071006_11398 [Candidatus Kentron sp. UNK]
MKNDMQFDREELQILQDFERGEFQRIGDFEAEKRKLEAAARDTLKKGREIDIGIYVSEKFDPFRNRPFVEMPVVRA